MIIYRIAWNRATVKTDDELYPRHHDNLLSSEERVQCREILIAA